MDLNSKINGIFDDGQADAKAKPQIKRSVAFAVAIGFLAIVTSAFTYSYLARAVDRMSILDVIGVLRYVIPAAGVVAFDLGAIFWSMVWRSNSSNGSQDMIARFMFILDVAGMSLTTLAHFVDITAMPVIVSDLTPYVVAMILIANVVAFVEYENKSDVVAAARLYRAKTAELVHQKTMAQIELEREETRLVNQIEAAQKSIRVAQLQEQLGQLQLQYKTSAAGSELLQSDIGTLEQAKQKAKENLTDRFKRSVEDKFGKIPANGNGTAPKNS